MAYSKNPERYPAEFHGIFESASAGRLKLQCKDAGEATSLQHQLNAYRRAVEEFKTPGYRDASNTIIRRDENTLILEPRSSKIQTILRNSQLDIRSSQELSETDIDAYLENASNEKPRTDDEETDSGEQEEKQKDSGLSEESSNNTDKVQDHGGQDRSKE